ncbi:MAG: hypothetical protein KDE59_00200 [Anaerolineales bacterium]|nr:hypothetical protein [Anaerolineales bacterium]MCB8960363.1 hypothetical protein [Ardenticatenales bacterium]
MSLGLILKLAVVIFFFVMFLRGSRLPWGIGLLTVTTAFLLDAFWSTFGFAQVQEDLGFFFFVIGGALVAGAALWLWALLRPVVASPGGAYIPTPRFRTEDGTPSPQPRAMPARRAAGTAFDRQMMHEQIRYRFGPDDLLDLMFDLRMNESDIVAPGQPLSSAVTNIIDLAEETGIGGELTLAVERILTPPEADNLPRLEKLSVDSPPTVLRHVLLAHFSRDQLRQFATSLNIDWEELGPGDKKSLTRGLLLYLYRRNRLDELLKLIQAAPAGS